MAFFTHEGTNRVDKVSEQLDVGVPLEYLPSVDSASMIALGHKSALADLFWIRGVLYFHNELSQYKQFDWLQQYIALVSSLDPKFLDIYKWGNAVLMFSRENIQLEHVEQANAIIDQGLAVFPDETTLATSGLANCTAYVKKPSPEVKKALERCKEKYAKIGAFQRNAASFMVLAYTQNMASEGEDDSLGCEAIKQLYQIHTDQSVRDQLVNRLKGSDCGAQSVELITAQRARFDEVSNTTFPYLSPDFVPQLIDMNAYQDN